MVCSGVEVNDFRPSSSPQPLKRNSSADRSSRNYPSIAILSSRVLLVSNLRRSNWKCTVKRFFKSTVMMSDSARGAISMQVGMEFVPDRANTQGPFVLRV